jgi:hypothetical protein
MPDVSFIVHRMTPSGGFSKLGKRTMFFSQDDSFKIKYCVLMKSNLRKTVMTKKHFKVERRNLQRFVFLNNLQILYKVYKNRILINKFGSRFLTPTKFFYQGIHPFYR